MSNTVDIIVIGTDHHNTLSMVRSFGESGYKVVLIVYGKARSYVASSIYVNESHLVNDSKATIECLKDLCKSACEKPVVITCSDEISSMMDLQYEGLKETCFFFNAGKAGRITQFMDKQKQVELARMVGFSVPQSLESTPNMVDYSKIKYPCFVKPKESVKGGKHLSICKSEQELKLALSSYNNEYSVLVQDYIPKDYEIVILGLTYEGKSYIPGFVKKHRERNGGTTYSTTCPISNMQESIVDSCRNMIQEIGYEGLWGIELIKQGNKYYFLELNMRNDATTYSLAVAGANLPYLYYVLCSHSESNVSLDVKSIDSIVEFEDVIFPLKGKVSFIKWLKQFKHCSCRYFYSKEDPAPYKIKKREFINLMIHKAIHI